MRDVLFWRGVFAVLGAVLVVVVARATKRWLAVLAIPLLTVGGYLLWYTNRTPPDPLKRTIREGVVYERSVVDGAVFHKVEIDLKTPGLTWLGTPADTSGGRQAIARTTTQFAEQLDATVAINTAYFAPWHSNTLLDYYPHVGDPVDCIGATTTDGVRVSPYDPNLVSLWVAPDGSVTIDDRDHPDARFAWSGFWLVDSSTIAQPVRGTAAKQRHPRTAAGLTRGGDRLILVVVDGRQPSYSDGVAFEPLARWMLAAGAHDAVLFDGGGSTTMVAREGGAIELLNTPVHGRHPPGLERPVACHLGLRF